MFHIVSKIRNLKSLTVTLAILFLILCTIVLVISASFHVSFTFQNQQRAINVQQQLIAEKAVSAVKEFLNNKFSMLFSAAHFSDLYHVSLENQKLTLEKLLGTEPSFRQFILLDKQHNELLNISRLSRTVSGQLAEPEKEVILSHTNQNKPYVSSVYIDDITYEPMVIMAVPVTDVFGDFKSALVAEINLKFMWDVMDQIEVGRRGCAYVVDNEGYLIAFKDISRVLKRENLAYLKEVGEFINGSLQTHKNKTDIARGIHGSFVLTTHVHLEMPDWSVVIEIPLAEAYETVITTLVTTIVGMVISLILAVILGIFLSRIITRPIIELRDATREIGQGHLTTRIHVESKNEIGDLARNFNKMVEDLKQTTVSRNALIKEVRERKQIEVRLKETMDKLTRSNEQYTYVASHDLQEPLRMISSYMSLLSKRYRNKLGSDAEEFIGYAVEGADRLQSLINDLLLYSRVNSRGKPFKKTNMEHVFGQVLASMRVSIERSRAIVTHDTLPAILADESQMIQLLRNLLDNAIKYSNQKRPQLHVSVKKRKREYEFSARDNGLGIKKEYQEKIFWIFQRLHARKEFSGTGIGLAICKKIVERHEGKIWVESEGEGKGSTFYFTIPDKVIDI